MGGEEDDFDPVGDALGPEHLQAIGYITAASSILESVMDEAIWYLASVTDRVGKIVTAQLYFTARLNMLRALADEVMIDAIFKDQLDGIIERLQKVQGYRNDIVHAKWRDSKGHQTAVYEKVKAREKLTSTVTSLTAAEIMERAQFIDFVMRDLSMFVINQKINRAFSWRRKS
jgi:hypothetical protein